MNKKHLISALLVLAVIATFVLYFTNRRWHPDNWITEHKVVYNRLKSGNLEYKNCLKCHEELRKQNKANFCNKCHKENGVKLVD